MYTDEERLTLIFQRTEEIKRHRKNNRRHTLEAICIVACVLMIVSLGVCMPGFMKNAVFDKTIHNSGVASLIAGQGSLGYIVVGIFAFILGALTTVLLYKLKERGEEKKGDSNEL